MHTLSEVQRRLAARVDANGNPLKGYKANVAALRSHETKLIRLAADPTNPVESAGLTAGDAPA